MADQLQGIAGRNRKVNKKLRVPMTMGPISDLFGVLWAHYPGTVFDEGEDLESLKKRMAYWHDQLARVHHIPLDVLKAVIRDLGLLEPYQRDVKCPTLERIVELCELKQAEMRKPRDMSKVNAERARIKAMMGGKAA